MNPVLTSALILLAGGGLMVCAGWPAIRRNPFSPAGAMVAGGLVTIAAGAALIIFGLL